MEIKSKSFEDVRIHTIDDFINSSNIVDIIKYKMYKTCSMYIDTEDTEDTEIPLFSGIIIYKTQKCEKLP